MEFSVFNDNNTVIIRIAVILILILILIMKGINPHWVVFYLYWTWNMNDPCSLEDPTRAYPRGKLNQRTIADTEVLISAVVAHNSPPPSMAARVCHRCEHPLAAPLH